MSDEPEGSGSENWGPRIRELRASHDAAGLVDLLDGDYWEWVHAREALYELGGNAVDALLGALERPEPRVRAKAAGILGGMDERRAVPPLLDQFHRIDPVRTRGPEFGVWARQAAATALGDIGDQRAVAPLVAALETRNPFELRDVARALRKLGDPDGVAAAEAREQELRDEREARDAARRAREATMTPEELATERLERRADFKRRIDEMFNRRPRE